MYPFSDGRHLGSDAYISLNQNESSLGRKRGGHSAVGSGMCQISETQAKLARSASICIKQVATLLRPDLTAPLPENFDQFVQSIQRILTPSWEWLLAIMDWTESQLRYGSALNKGKITLFSIPLLKSFFSVRTTKGKISNFSGLVDATRPQQTPQRSRPQLPRLFNVRSVFNATAEFGALRRPTQSGCNGAASRCVSARRFYFTFKDRTGPKSGGRGSLCPC